jgi:hypothetical protein
MFMNVLKTGKLVLFAGLVGVTQEKGLLISESALGAPTTMSERRYGMQVWFKTHVK